MLADKKISNIKFMIHGRFTSLFTKTQFTKKTFKGVQHPRALVLKTLCIFSKHKATLDKVSYMDLVKNVPRNSKITVLLQ